MKEMIKVARKVQRRAPEFDDRLLKLPPTLHLSWRVLPQSFWTFQPLWPPLILLLPTLQKPHGLWSVTASG